MADNSSSATYSGNYLLSICISTRNRCALLIQTITSALSQMGEQVEIVVVDGASNDDTQQAMERIAAEDGRVRYFREPENGGIDRDYDKAVIYAKGAYCWLMSDDDFFLPGAIGRVLDATLDSPSLIIVDAEVRNVDQSKLLLHRRMDITSDLFIKMEDFDLLFLTAGKQLTFIGAVVIRRSMWLERDRETYYGSFFIHVGVIFQQPLPHGAIVIMQPCLSIRYGNASWTERTFEIWMFRWPQLVWSLPSLSLEAKRRVVLERPYESVRDLILLRAKGAYSWTEYRRWLAFGPSSWNRKLVCAAIALFPGVLINLLAIAYTLTFSRATRFAMVDLIGSRYFPFKLVRDTLSKPQVNEK